MLTRILLFAVLLMLVFRALGRVLRGIAEGAGGSPPRSRGTGRSAPTAPAKGEVMVRDPMCGTYVVQARALSARGRDGQHYFCSEKCRDEYLSAGREAGL
jgi:YHS domain-containing protein